MNPLTLTTLTAGVLAAMLASGVAAAAEPVHTFSGSCTVEIQVLFDPPLHMIEPRESTSTFTFSGICDGSIDGAPSRAHDVVGGGSTSGLVTCPLWLPVGQGAAQITDVESEITFDFTVEVFGDNTIHLTGHKGGHAVGVLTAGEDTDFVDHSMDCLAGEADYSKLRLQATVATVLPLRD